MEPYSEAPKKAIYIGNLLFDIFCVWMSLEHWESTISDQLEHNSMCCTGAIGAHHTCPSLAKILPNGQSHYDICPLFCELSMFRCPNLYAKKSTEEFSSKDKRGHVNTTFCGLIENMERLQ